MTGTLTFPNHSIPLWASELVSAVCADHSHPQPTVRWIHPYGKANYYRGRAWTSRNHISIHLGPDTIPELQRKLLLHELAHLLTSHRHNERFYIQAYRLYVKYGVDLMFAYSIERHYKLMGRVIGAEFLAGLLK